MLITSFHQRLKDQYLQQWSSVIQESTKLNFYKLIKTSYCLHNCINVLNVRKFRHFYMSLKLGSLSLEIQRGRFNNIPRNERLCKLCGTDVEDEYHLVLKCPIYEDLRELYLPRKYTNNPNVNKFILLMSSRNEKIICNIATFVHSAWVKRKIILSQNL